MPLELCPCFLLRAGDLATLLILLLSFLIGDVGGSKLGGRCNDLGDGGGKKLSSAYSMGGCILMAGWLLSTITSISSTETLVSMECVRVRMRGKSNRNKHYTQAKEREKEVGSNTFELFPTQNVLIKKQCIYLQITDIKFCKDNRVLCELC